MTIVSDDYFGGGGGGERYFSIIDNAWVSRNRELISYSRCMSASNGDVYKELRYDNGDVRYVNVNSSGYNLSATRVASVSSIGWKYIICPDLQPLISEADTFNTTLNLTGGIVGVYPAYAFGVSAVQPFPVTLPIYAFGVSAANPIPVSFPANYTIGISGNQILTVSAINPSFKQYNNTPSNYGVSSVDTTVFTLNFGEKGYIQNVHTGALAVKYGASASTTSFNYILKGGATTYDGNGGSLLVDDWIGAVSVASFVGTNSGLYMGWKLV